MPIPMYRNLATVLLSILFHILSFIHCFKSGDLRGNTLRSGFGMGKFEQNQITVPSSTWPTRSIPYELGQEINEFEEQVILGAMEEIAGETCVKFKRRESESDFIYIQLGPSCASHVGRKGGKQNITLKYSQNPTTNCVTHGEVMHELMHAIGFLHEQSRPDRDRFVKVHLANLRKHVLKKNDFKKYIGARDFGLPYDYSSIMHYSKDALQRRPNVLTITTKIKGVPIGLRFHLSHFDKVKINMLYNCSSYK